MLSKAIFQLSLGALIIAFFFACSGDNNNPTYPFERTVLNVSIAKRCISGSFESGANCYLMLWRHPDLKKDLEGYYVWLDTTVVKDSVQNITQAQMNAASKKIPYSGIGESDSLDLTDLIKDFLDRDSLHIAIWAKYSGSEQGEVNHFHAYFGDDIPPSTPLFSDSASSSTIWIKWTRPADQRDFYSPGDMDGPIAGYNVNIQAIRTNENIHSLDLKISLAGNDASANIQRNYRFAKKNRGVSLENVTNTSINFLGTAITDGGGFVNDNEQANTWIMEISGLQPMRSYRISISAWDNSGNSSSTERYLSTTDATPPFTPGELWYYKNADGNALLSDTNRLILFWERSLDLHSSGRYVDVETYSVEQLNGASWEAVSRVNATLPNDYYAVRYRLDNNTNTMIQASNGVYVSDTLHWVLPGDNITLRIRAIDSSKHYSEAREDIIAVSKGNECMGLPNFVPVKGESSVFCMEKLQRYSGNRFEKNVLYIEAKRKCEEQGYRLCTEQEWNAACNSGGNSYGVIEERNFRPAEFLSRNCGVGTGDTLLANNVDKRKKICASPDGVRDLPGHLQEWVIGAGSSGEEIPMIKGSSYASFTGASIVELSLCKNRFTPTRIRPRYTTENVYLYRNGSRLDTLENMDPNRTLHAVLGLSDFKDTILIYSLKSSADDLLGTDFVDLKEYRRRGGDKWLDVLWQGLKYAPEETRRVLILGTESINASKIFLDPSVGFRCCKTASP
jgi:hypothetical protein